MSGRPLSEIAPGVVHFPRYLSMREQQALVEQCRAIGGAPTGMYTPTVRGGKKMSIQMLSLGRHWNPLTYTYEAIRADVDGLPPPPLPKDWIELAARIAHEAGMSLTADVCILNYYPAGGRLGLHQDKDERRETLDAGVPIVSVSLGDTARFLLGGLKRKDPVETMMLASGDALVMGGPARLRYHGVSRILSGTAPAELALEGRFNLTFRQY